MVDIMRTDEPQAIEPDPPVAAPSLRGDMIRGSLWMVATRWVMRSIGLVGTIFGNHKVNIADMTVGRDKPGGRARTLISIDDKISDKALETLRGSENILDAKLIKL